jgi:acyl-CoA reductase-like NAD-dependent aldehyde dehydrogenase
VNDSHFQRLTSLLDKSNGTIVLGGESDASKKYIAPTVVKDVQPDDSLMSE